jgi:F420-dependent oxidoreductase-like protein
VDVARFGLQIPNFSYGVPDAEIFPRVLDAALAAEAGGFDSVWVMDHLYQLPALGGADQPMLEAYTLLGALAARTERIHLGSLVTGVTYRNPALLAKMITTLDVISGGRAILGIGAAWYDVEHIGLGFDFPTAKGRLDRLEEAVQICRAMFTQEQPTFHGEHYRIEAARNVPRPIQPGGPKIMIGGGGEKRTLRLVARYADMCNVFGDAEGIRHKIAVLREHCDAVGRDPAEISVTRLATLVLADTPEEGERIREAMIAIAGADAVRARHVGTEQEILDGVAEIIDAGVDHLIFNMPTSDPEEVGRIARLLTANFA